MGTNQSLPKITAQDKAILECVSPVNCVDRKLSDEGPSTSSLKLQRDKLKQYQKKVRTECC